MPLSLPFTHVDLLDALASSTYTEAHYGCESAISVPIFSGASSSNNRG